MLKKIKKIIYKNIIKPKTKIYGKNNIIEYNNSSYFKNVNFKIWGNNNRIIIKDNVYLHNTNIKIGQKGCPVEDAVVYIGENTYVNSLKIEIGESNSKITIGRDCMISYDVALYCTDTHSIIDRNNELINYGKSIEIGNHVWICQEVRIMKNTKIPDNCVVAIGSLVTKEFETKNSIIAGVPAKTVKEGINWLTERPEHYQKKARISAQDDWEDSQ